MSDIKDYTTSVSEEGNTHYSGVSSLYGRMVDEQNKMQPNYADPGCPDGKMHGDKRNEQAGP